MEPSGGPRPRCSRRAAAQAGAGANLASTHRTWASRPAKAAGPADPASAAPGGLSLLNPTLRVSKHGVHNSA